MNDNELIARSHAALAAHALSLCEHFVMCSVDYRVNAGPETLIRHATGVSAGDPRGAFTEAEYRDALASCMRRGLLKVLGPEDFDPDGRRVYLRDTPLGTQPEFADYAPGHVEFTVEGYRINEAVLLAIFGEGWRTAEGEAQ